MVAAPPPIDENKLQLVREFLQREFRASRHEDYFDSVEMAQVFVIDPIQGPRHTLVIPKRTFEDPDFTMLCDARLVEALQSALDTRLVLTPEGADRSLRMPTLTLTNDVLERLAIRPARAG